MSIVSTFSAASSRALGHIGHVDQRRGFDETYIPIVYYGSHYAPQIYKYNYKTNTNTIIHHYNDSQYSGITGNFYAGDGRVFIVQMPDGDFVMIGSGSTSNTSSADALHLDKSDDGFTIGRNHRSQYDGYGEQRSHITWNPDQNKPAYHISPHANTNTYAHTILVDPDDGSTDEAWAAWYGPFHSGEGGVGFCLLKDVNALGKTDMGDRMVMVGGQASSPGVDTAEEYVFANTPSDGQYSSPTKINTQISSSRSTSYSGVAPYNKTKAVVCTNNSSDPMWYYDDGDVATMHSDSKASTDSGRFKDVFQVATGVWGGYNLTNMRVFKGGLDTAYTWRTDLTSELDIGTDGTDYRVLMVIGSGNFLYILREQNGDNYTYKMAKLIFDLADGSYTVDGDKTVSGIGNSFSNHACYFQYYN